MVQQRVNGSWHKARASLYAKVKNDIETAYSDIRIGVDDGVVFARGSFPVADSDDILDRFLIELEFPKDYPDSVPILREVGGRIPWHEDRHTNRTGEACPIIPEEWLVRLDRDSILEFLGGPVRNFFIGQILVEHGKPWPFGERPHGVPGLVEFYGELIGTTDKAAVRRFLDYLGKETVKGHWECPCGSGKRLRNCHLEMFRSAQQRIAPWIAKQALNRLLPTPSSTARKHQ